MKLTVNNIARATLTAQDAAANLPLAAQAALSGKAQIDEGKARGASALALTVAGLASDVTAERKWSFDVTAKDGTVHYHVDCTGFDEFGGTEGEWRYNGEGKVSRAAEGAYLLGSLHTFFGLTEKNAAVWLMYSKAVPIARAIRAEGMTATIENGELKLEGGTSDRAAAMREAKTATAIGKIASGATGTNRAAPQNSKGGDSDGDTGRAATPSEILAAAFRLIDGAAKGEEALASVALDYARRIAKAVNDNPDAFAAD